MGRWRRKEQRTKERGRQLKKGNEETRAKKEGFIIHFCIAIVGKGK